MTPLQSKILELLQVFDRLCRENGLQYYMLGGTMLGAIRHGGFIPWDDDADVGLPRADYEKLLRQNDIRLPQTYDLRHFSKEKGVPYAFMRLEDKTTTCVETRRSGSGYVGGVYIDIFPLDYDSADSALQKRTEKRIKRKKKLFYAHIADQKQIESEKRSTSGLKKVLLQGKLLGIQTVRIFTDRQKLAVALDRCVQNHEKKHPDSKEHYSNYLGHWGRRESVPREWFSGKNGAGEYLFEGYKLWGPCESDLYLKALYGADYMIPPKDTEQTGHPAKILLLDCPYEKWKIEHLEEEK